MNLCKEGENDVNQASTNHEDLLKYDGPITRSCMKKFKDILGVFEKKEIMF